MYDDEYATCQETYATFRLWHADLEPEHITRELGIIPSRAHRKGDDRGKDRPPFARGMWQLTTKDVVQSRDSRRHLDVLLERLREKREVLDNLRLEGYQMDITCFWVGSGGGGGPTLSPQNLEQLARLGLELSFDFYADNEAL